MERGLFVFGVFGVAEADEETALDFGELSRAAAAFVFSLHDGFEGVDVGPVRPEPVEGPTLSICFT